MNCCVVLCVNFGGDIDIIGVMVMVICGVLYGVNVIDFVLKVELDVVN